jgi:hypothetical protein
MRAPAVELQTCARIVGRRAPRGAVRSALESVANKTQTQMQGYRRLKKLLSFKFIRCSNYMIQNDRYVGALHARLQRGLRDPGEILKLLD